MQVIKMGRRRGKTTKLLEMATNDSLMFFPNSKEIGMADNELMKMGKTTLTKLPHQNFCGYVPDMILVDNADLMTVTFILDLLELTQQRNIPLILTITG